MICTLICMKWCVTKLSHYVFVQRCGMEYFCGQQSPPWSSTYLQLCSPSPHCVNTRWPDSCPLPSSSWASWDQFVGECSPVSLLPVCTVCVYAFLGLQKWNKYFGSSKGHLPRCQNMTSWQHYFLILLFCTESRLQWCYWVALQDRMKWG